MIHELVCHPATSPSCAFELTVSAARPDRARLELSFRVTGRVDRIAWPQKRSPVFTDGLWQHSCFEAFVKGDGERYRELNFSPSSEWAAYQFDGYRSGLGNDFAVHPPAIGWRMDVVSVELRTEVLLPRLGFLPAWHLGLSAVIEEIDGTKSYWALAHAPGPPDFHNPACFNATLPAPAAP